MFQPRSICFNLGQFDFFFFLLLLLRQTKNIFGTFDLLFILLLYLPHLLFPPCSPNIPTCILFISMLTLGTLNHRPLVFLWIQVLNCLTIEPCRLGCKFHYFFNYIYIVVVINFLKLFKSDILIKENIPPIITLQYMYLCPNYIQINLTVISN